MAGPAVSRMSRPWIDKTGAKCATIERRVACWRYGTREALEMLESSAARLSKCAAIDAGSKRRRPQLCIFPAGFCLSCPRGPKHARSRPDLILEPCFARNALCLQDIFIHPASPTGATNLAPGRFSSHSKGASPPKERASGLRIR